MRVLALIAVCLLLITTGVGTAVFCYGADHSQAESIFSSCCARGSDSSQKPFGRGSSVPSKASVTKGSPSCGPCIDVPLALTEQQGVSAPEFTTSSSSFVDGLAGIIITSSGEALSTTVPRSTEKPDPILPSSSSSLTTVLRC